MAFETEKQQQAIQRWSRLAIQLLGAAESGRFDLERHWKIFAQAYEPEQFRVRRNGLALLVAYVLHLIDILHTKVPV